MTGSSGSLVAAIDVGGTTIKGALVAENGELTAGRRIAIADVSPARLVPTVIATMGDLVAEADVVTDGVGAVAVGLAVPGVVDERAGVGRYSMILGWRDVGFGELLRRFDRPVAFGHDVSAGAYAEARRGPAQGHRDWLFIALGTGLGSTFVLHGRPYRGDSGTGGELAHVVVRPDGPMCRCGKRGCLEMVATGPAIADAYAAATGSAKQTVTAAQVAGLVREGDASAVAVWSSAIDALAKVVASYAESMNPSLVVVGGGLAEAGDLLIEPLAAAVRRQVAFADPPAVVLAHHGADAGLVGVAVAAHELADRGDARFDTPFSDRSRPPSVPPDQQHPTSDVARNQQAQP